MPEERRQLNIVFAIFGGAVIIIAIIRPITRRLLYQYLVTKVGGSTGVNILTISDNLFAALTDFACIFVILYIHHINFRPETLTSRKTIQYSQPVVTPTINENPSLSSI